MHTKLLLLTQSLHNKRLVLILRICNAALHSSLTFVYLRKMDLLDWQVVEYFWELVLSIFDCFLVIDYV